MPAKEMQAKELMTAEVVSVSQDTHVTEIAALLLKHRISAVPVVDSAGAPIGMVSEGDLLGRDKTKVQDGGDWLLMLLVEGETLHPDFIASVPKPACTARDVMSKPVITVTETMEAPQIASVLLTHRIKRVPVIRDDRIVGIVSRADLLRALTGETSAQAKAGSPSYLADSLIRLDKHFLHRRQSDTEVPMAGVPQQPDDSGVPTSAAFQALAKDFVHAQSEHRNEARRAISEHSRQQVKELSDHHVADASWKALLQDAREAAKGGEKQFRLLRFPCDLCSDRGRAINVPLPGWPETLRGEAAEIYRRWEQDLRPKGFHIGASVLEFPGGLPGDIGLFLKWDE